MKSAEYWRRAALLREIAVQEGATYAAEEVLRLYGGALEDIDGEIRRIKYNFRKRYGIDEATAEYHLSRAMREENLNTLIELLEAAPDDAARAEILGYIQRDGLSVRAYVARTERYEQLKSVIYAKTMKIAAESVGIVGNMLKNAYKESYYGMIDDTAKGLDVGVNFAILNEDTIDEAVGAKWHGKRFSQRIWGNTDRLAATAQDLVVKAIISGESYSKTAKKLADEFGAEKFHAATLIHTEAAHIHARADLKAYKDLGAREYKYLATLDYRTCEVCQPLDGRVFKLSEAREGDNYPTMHPRCRCTTTLNIDYTNRRARDPLTGKSELVDGSLTYEEWKKGLTPEQRDALELARKKDSRKSADKLKAAVDKSSGSDIIKAKNVETAVSGVNFIGKIDREIYKCVAKDITTDEVIITDERIEHIKEHHPGHYERISPYLKDAVEEPDYILKDAKNTGLILKRSELEDIRIQTVLRVHTTSDKEGYKNSIISAWEISESRWENYINNKIILYKRK